MAATASGPSGPSFVSPANRIVISVPVSTGVTDHVPSTLFENGSETGRIAGDIDGHAE